MKQSVVEFIFEELENMQNGFPHFTPEQIYNKAKEMFEKQIIEAGNTCSLKQTIHNRKVDLMSLEELEDYAQKDTINVGEEYYNETFKNK